MNITLGNHDFITNSRICFRCINNNNRVISLNTQRNDTKI